MALRRSGEVVSGFASCGSWHHDIMLLPLLLLLLPLLGTLSSWLKANGSRWQLAWHYRCSKL